MTPILQTDASDYGVGGYLFSVTNGKVRVIRFFSKALIGAQLDWSAHEKECYGIYFGVKTFENLLDNRHFILKTDHILKTTWHFTYAMIPERRSTSRFPMPFPDIVVQQPAIVPPKNRIPSPIYKKISNVHNSKEGHWGVAICKKRLRDPSITERTIRDFIRQSSK